jgi:hypothetical protein
MLCDDPPIIQTCCDVEAELAPKIQDNLVKCFCRKNCNKDHGKILIHACWACETDCIIEVHIMDLYAKSQCSKYSRKVLAAHEKEEKNEYLEAWCMKQREHFNPFVVLIWMVYSYVNAGMCCIAIVYATCLCLCGSQIPTGHISNYHPQWEDKAGLGIFHR